MEREVRGPKKEEVLMMLLFECPQYCISIFFEISGFFQLALDGFLDFMSFADISYSQYMI